LTPNSNRYDG